MRMVDLCLASEGTEVILATSSDEKYPPENIIDGNSATFWATTGMFPQEFIICFHKHVKIEKLSLQCYFGHTAFQRSPQGFKYGKLDQKERPLCRRSRRHAGLTELFFVTCKGAFLATEDPR
ncbi:intraflagellar transport protein 25 homolog isoform X3 [Vombatus ursinus]|uniref:intraflagellar transport protein 25 homolog isoform X3 n=1 Tax=Vombatus ursinus TaxID=29139 RepID=UPI000FFD24CC|nr:intraflagellar transport protein 25 homolog isoform X3 [Vombatus ursinus]